MISWLAVQGKLVTKEIISHWGLITYFSGLLCDIGVDDVSLIMTNYSYTKQVTYFVNVQTSLIWEVDIQLHARTMLRDSKNARRRWLK